MGKVWMTDHKVEPRIWDIEECLKTARFCKKLLSLEHSKGIILSTLASNLSETTAGYTMFSLLQQTVPTSLNKCRSHFKKQFLTSCFHQTTETVQPRGLGDIRWVKNFAGNRISEAPKLCEPFRVQNLWCYIHKECDNHSSGNTPIGEGITFSLVPRIHRRKDPFWATRVGEAANPGPETFRFAIINPTAILGKIQDICTLNAHVISLSENSATKSVQMESSQTWRKFGFKSIWSQPVAAHNWTFKEDEARRGQASGTSIHSILPIRKARVELTAGIEGTRIVSAIVQCGKWPILVITIYGYPQCQKEAKQKTNQLLIEAINQAEQTRLPSLIVGDLNVPFLELSSSQWLLQEGYQTMDQLYFKKYGNDMPFTCREATRPDQAIVHPKLIPYVQHIEVNKTKVVPDHDPIVFHLGLPMQQPMTQNWKLPSSWIPYEPDQDLIETAFLKNWIPPKPHHTEDSLSDALKLWATTCEEAVDWAVRTQHAWNPEKFPQKMLPSKAKGRNQTRKIVQKPITNIAKACDGQYDPPIETASFKLRHWVRQLRRLQSFLNRVRKLQHLEIIWTHTQQQLQQEWHAITTAKGFKQGFPTWCINFPEIGYFPLSLPDESFLMITIQLLRHHCDITAAEEKSVRNKLQKYVRHQDATSKGLQQAAKETKGPSNPNLYQTERYHELPFTLVCSHGGLATLEFQEEVPFNFQGKATCGEQEVQFVDIQGRIVDVMIIDADCDLPEQGTLKQKTICMEPEKIAQDLTQYWNGFWQRDTKLETEDEAQWNNFISSMNAVSTLPTLSLDLSDYAVWHDVIKNSKSTSARGVDGWYMDEIKLLPAGIIKELADIFVSHEGHAFGQQDMQVITIPMGKVEDPEKPAQTRPITLLGMLYRLWSKVSSKILLKQLQHTLPESIIGFIPGRSMQLAMLKQQFAFEQLHLHPGTVVHWEGVTLDIVKCFNAIARLPATLAMEKIGIPKTWIKTWSKSLHRTKRYWKIHEQLWEGDLTTTGCPEGDCWSILACLGLSYIWATLASVGSTLPTAFADNWNWRSQDTDSNVNTIQCTIRFLAAIKLQIDWNKTWIWCTRSVIKEAWKQIITDAIPQADIRVVTSARELGYTMHYNRVQNRHTQKERTVEAMKRWKKLQKLPINMDDKCKIANWALIKAMYATECYAVGQSWLQKCRTAIAKSLIPNRKTTNPFLATMLLSKHTSDPELYIILESLRATRHLMWHMTTADQKVFCQHVAKHSRKHTDVYGPAGALAYNLARIGWSLTAQGVLLTDTVVSFHILTDAIPTIEQFLEKSWMKHIMQVGIQRPAWRNFPAINRKLTLQAFTKLPEFQKRIGSYHLTGSCMMNDQKKHFTDLTDACQLCGQPDSETHRLLECFETNATRQKYPEIINFLREHDECYHHLPVAWESTSFEFDWVFFQSRPLIQIDTEVLQQMQQASIPDQPISSLLMDRAQQSTPKAKP